MAGRAGRTNKSCVKSEELEERSKEVRSPKKRQGAAKRLRACTMGEPMGAHIPREPGMGTREHGTHRHAAAWSWAAARGASPRPPSLIWKTRLPAALTITKIKVGGKGRGYSSAISGHSKFASVGCPRIAKTRHLRSAMLSLVSACAALRADVAAPRCSRLQMSMPSRRSVVSGSALAVLFGSDAHAKNAPPAPPAAPPKDPNAIDWASYGLSREALGLGPDPNAKKEEPTPAKGSFKDGRALKKTGGLTMPPAASAKPAARPTTASAPAAAPKAAAPKAAPLTSAERAERAKQENLAILAKEPPARIVNPKIQKQPTLGAKIAEVP